MRGRILAAVVFLLACVTALPAHAFCGFYVSGADTKLLNEATEVVLLRDGTRTVLSMENRYAGPPQDFALVVPVPVVLQKDQVRTLKPEVFARLDTLTSPRLVEYWEQDPCSDGLYDEEMPQSVMAAGAKDNKEGGFGTRAHVTVEAQFAVGEYEIVILGADDSSALDAWLRQNKYKIPDGAEPYLRPYVATGSKFFVAKVDTKKVKWGEDGRARLSPLRFHYDSDTFSLPVRLGLLNSGGTQDLVVHILAYEKRYEVANYPNVTIPTNIDVADSVRNTFPTFYAALYDKTLAQHPKAIVTEYSWSAGSCDPCPGPTMDFGDLATLGADVAVTPRGKSGNYVVTRLHARYSKEALGEDLVFKEAGAIEGGREDYSGKAQSQEAKPSEYNNFQARYIIRHPWTGALTCTKPTFGQWGGPPGESKPKVEAANDTVFAKRDLDLPTVVVGSITSLGTKGNVKLPPHQSPPLFALPTGPYGATLVGLLLGAALVLVLAARRPRDA